MTLEYLCGLGFCVENECVFTLHAHSGYALTACPLSPSLPEWLAVGICIFEAHLLQLTASVQLVVAGVGLLPQIFHVDPDQHLSEFYEVTVALVLN